MTSSSFINTWRRSVALRKLLEQEKRSKCMLSQVVSSNTSYLKNQQQYRPFSSSHIQMSKIDALDMPDTFARRHCTYMYNEYSWIDF